MDMSTKKRPEAQRRAAQERNAKIELRSAKAREAMIEHEKQVKAKAEKVSQLRALRLAKEAADRTALEVAPVAVATPRRAAKPAAKREA